MDDRKTYWFEQPHMPGMFNVAVQPIVDPRTGACILWCLLLVYGL